MPGMMGGMMPGMIGGGMMGGGMMGMGMMGGPFGPARAVFGAARLLAIYCSGTVPIETCISYSQLLTLGNSRKLPGVYHGDHSGIPVSMSFMHCVHQPDLCPREIERLQDRWDAFKAGRLESYDATWTSGYVPLSALNI